LIERTVGEITGAAWLLEVAAVVQDQCDYQHPIANIERMTIFFKIAPGLLPDRLSTATNAQSESSSAWRIAEYTWECPNAGLLSIVRRMIGRNAG
jgi:hypothetical protein